MIVGLKFLFHINILFQAGDILVFDENFQNKKRTDKISSNPFKLNSKVNLFLDHFIFMR